MNENRLVPGLLVVVCLAAPHAVFAADKKADKKSEAQVAGYLEYVTTAPALWRRFAEKYGDGDEVTNLFFGDHSLSAKRAQDLEREIANNYRDPSIDPPTRAAKTAGK